MKRYTAILVTMLLMAVSTLRAQVVTVDVTPVSPVLPPQAALYLADPGRFFNVTLTNLSDETLHVFLGIGLEQTLPSDITLHTPVNQQPATPVTLYPSSPKTLDRTELKQLFREMSLSDIVVTGANLNDFTNGTVGLMPEGHYIGRLMAYRWDPAVYSPEALSNPLMGSCQFDICYRAAAPVILSPADLPMAGSLLDEWTGDEGLYNAVEVDFNNPVNFSWSPVTQSCAATAPQVTYDLEFFRLNTGQTPEEAVRYDMQSVYHVNGLRATSLYYNDTKAATQARFHEGEYYVMRVKANTTQNDASRNDYMLLENEGYSPLRVIRVKTYDFGNEDGPKEEPEVSDEGGVHTRKKPTSTKPCYSWPKITKPEDRKGVWTASRLTKESDIELAWEEPKPLVETESKPSFKYIVGVYKISDSDVENLNSLVSKGTPIYEKSGFATKSHTITWSEIKDNIALGEDYMVIVRAETDADISYSDAYGDNCYRFCYEYEWNNTLGECDGDAEIADQTAVALSMPGAKPTKVTIDNFPLFITSAKESGGSGSLVYSGEGYVVWKPYGAELKFAVKFSDIKVNKGGVVFEGEVHSKAADGASAYVDMAAEISNYCVAKIDNPYLTLANFLTTKGVQGEVKNLLSGYSKYANNASSAYSILAAGMGMETDVPISLPVGVPEDMIPDLPISVSIADMVFKPKSASLSLIAILDLPGRDPSNTDDILAFGCPQLCIKPESLWPEQGIFGLLADFTATDPDSNLPLTFKSPTNWSDLDAGGTFITWKNGEFDCLGIEAECTLNGLYKDNDGKRDKNQHPTLAMKTVIRDWDDWLVDVTFDPFQIPEAPGFSFAAGENIVFDHSIRRNTSNFKLPANYKLKTSGFGSLNEWEGLYIKRLEMQFPGMLTIVDNDPDKGRDSEPGEEAFQRNGRLTLALNEFLLDMAPKGTYVSFDFSAENIFSAGTVKMGGWGISLDAINFVMLQNTFVNAGFNGKFQVPLLNGTVGYQAMLQATNYTDGNGNDAGNELELLFKTRQVEDMSLDFFLAEANFMPEGTYFEVRHQFESDYREANTDVELLASGTIDILSEKSGDGSKKSKIGFKLPGIKFVGMRLGNKPYEEMHKGNWLGAGLDEAMEKFLDPKNKDKGAQYDADGEFLTVQGTKEQSGKKHDDGFRPEEDRGKTTDQIIMKREAAIANGNLYFSLGSWSKASPEKNFWGLPFEIAAPALSMEGTDLKLGLGGTLSLFGEQASDAAETMNGLATTAMFSIRAGITNIGEAVDDLDFSKLGIEFKAVDFDSLVVEGSFGGGMVTAKGKVGVVEDGSRDGFNAVLKINVNKLFDIGVAGAYYKAAEGYRAGYLAGKVDAQGGIPIGPVTLNGISGGFLFNMGLPAGLNLESADMYAAIKDNDQMRKGSFGGAFGLKMTVGEESFIKGGLGMLVMYDAQRDRLSTFHLTGTVDAINLGDADGVVHAKCDMVYEDTPEVQQFTLNVTVDAQADMATMYKSFTGTDLKLPEALAGLEEFDSSKADDQGEDTGEQSSTSADGSRSKSSAEQNAEKKGFVSGGVGAHLSLEFQFRYYPHRSGKEKEKWHLYLGKPTPESERCRITFIDFAIGKGKPVGLWAKVYANAYLCLGNELPDNGQLPPIPAKVEEALGGVGADGKSHSSEFSKKLAAAQQEVIKNGPAGNINGGIMFGAALGAELGVNALFCYAAVEGMLGFDVVLKKFDEDCKCTDGEPMGGKNGFYAMGQIYAMLKGELGLMVDLWIYKGKIPLVDMTVGALLKGGLPNPSWAYGKVRAKGEVLGGLIKFCSTIEMKAGRICVPEGGNPLDDIQIFGDYSLGEEKYSQGWAEGNEVNPNPTLDFTTNMPIETPIKLFDETRAAEKAGLSGDLEDYRYDAECQRNYKFFLDKNFEVLRYQNDNPDKGTYSKGQKNGSFWASYSAQSADKESYRVGFGALNPESYYSVHLTGYAKEYYNGDWRDPRYKKDGKEEPQPWTDELMLYFKTDTLFTNAMDYVEFSIPFSDGYSPKDGYKRFTASNVSWTDARNPQFIMNRSRADLWNDPEFEYYGQLHRLREGYLISGLTQVTDEKKNSMAISSVPDEDWWEAGVEYQPNFYTLNMEPVAGSEPKYNYIQMVETCEQSADQSSSDSYLYYTFMPVEPISLEFVPSLFYRFRVIRLRKGELQDYMDVIEERFKNMLQMTADGEAVYQEKYAEGTESDETSAVAKVMLDYYNELKNEMDADEAEQRLMAYRQQVLADSRSKFSDVMGEMFYSVGGSIHFEDWLKRDRGEVLTATTGEKSTSSLEDKFIQHQIYSIEHDDSYYGGMKSAIPGYYDPYESINAWGKSMIKASIPGFRLTTKPIEAMPMTVTFNNTGTQYEKLVKYRNYTLGSTVNDQWQAGGGYVDENFVKDMSIVNRDRWFDGLEHFGVLTNSLGGCLVSDAALAVNLDQGLASQWYNINWGRTFSEYLSLQSESIVFDFLTEWCKSKGDVKANVLRKRSALLEWNNYQYVLMLGAELRSMEQYNDGWLTERQFHRWPDGTFDRLDMIRSIYGDGAYWGTGQTVTSHTYVDGAKSITRRPLMPRTKYCVDGWGVVSVDNYNRNHSQFVKDYQKLLDQGAGYRIRSIVSVFDYKTYVDGLKGITYRVRRLTGYNCNNATNGKNPYGLRPSTAGEYQATISLPMKHNGSVFNQSTTRSYTTSDLTVASADTIFVPDPVFRTFLFSHLQVDKNSDHVLQRSEAENITSLSINNYRLCSLGYEAHIKDLTGIEAMVNLETLDIEQNDGKCDGLKIVDLSRNIKLTKVSLDLDVLESLNVSNCSELEDLKVGAMKWNSGRTYDRTGLSELDLRGCPNLKYLEVQDNLLTSLDLNNNLKLKKLWCYSNMLSNLDLSKHSNLIYDVDNLRIGRQYKQYGYAYQCKGRLVVVPSLVATTSELTQLGFVGCSNYGSRDSYQDVTVTGTQDYNANVVYDEARLQGATLKDDLDPKLYDYLCSRYGEQKYGSRSVDIDYEKMRQATSLSPKNLGIRTLKNLGKWMPKLQQLDCSDNSIYDIDMDEFPNLSTLKCQNNKIQAITATQKTSLVYLYASDNQIRGFSGTNHPKLRVLDLTHNLLSGIMLKKNNGLQTLKLGYNQLERLDLTGQGSALTTLDISDNRSLSNLLTSNSFASTIQIFRAVDVMLLELEITQKKYTQLQEIDVIGAESITIEFSNKYSKLRVLRANCKMTGSANCNIDLSSLERLELRGIDESDFRRVFGSSILYVTCPKLKYLDLSSTMLTDLYLSLVTQIDTLKMGNSTLSAVANRKAFLHLFTDEQLQKWEEWRMDPDNYWVTAFSQSGKMVGNDDTGANAKDIAENVVRMRRAIGDRLYQRLKDKYAPDELYFTPSMAEALDSLDCHGLGIVSDASDGEVTMSTLQTYFPNIIWLDCSDNYLTAGPYFKNLRYLDISGNEKLKEINCAWIKSIKTLIAKNTNLVYVNGIEYSTLEYVDLSSTQVNVNSLNSILRNGVKKVVVRNCKKLDAVITITDQPIVYLDASDTNLRGVSVNGSTSLKYLDVHNAQLAGYSPQGGQIINASNLRYLDLHGNYLKWLKVYGFDISENRADENIQSTLLCGDQRHMVSNPVKVDVKLTLGEQCDEVTETKIVREWLNHWSGRDENIRVELTNSLTLVNAPSEVTQMREALGATLYQRLKRKYAYAATYLFPKDLEAVDSLDCKNMGFTSLNAIATYMPNLTKLDCSGNALTSIPSSLAKLEYLDVSDNADLKILNANTRTLKSVKTLVAKNTGITLIFDCNYLGAESIDMTGSKTTLATLNALCCAGIKKIVVADCTTISGTLTMNNGSVEYLDASGTHLNGLTISGATSLQHLDVHDARLGIANLKSGVATGSVVIDAPALCYLDLTNNYLEKLTVTRITSDRSQTVTFWCGLQKDRLQKAISTTLYLGDSSAISKVWRTIWTNTWSKQTKNRGVELGSSASPALSGPSIKLSDSSGSSSSSTPFLRRVQ